MRYILLLCAALSWAASAVYCPAGRADEPASHPASAAVAAEDATPKQFADFLAKAYGDGPAPEGARQLMAILSGTGTGAGEGWFGPAQTRFDWAWLAGACGVEPLAPAISQEQFAGPPELFAVLDRNRDGAIQPMDIDWSEENPYVQMAYTLNRVFRRIDAKGAGGLTRDEWLQFFDAASKGEEKLTSANFSGALLAGYTGSFLPGDGPSEAMLIRGLFGGEIGSMFEGPKVGQPAPRFRLRLAEGEGSIELSSLLGEKPLVLVFGNFTCGPFRAFYPAVDALYEKYKDRANFLMVYVREAHPTDGWKMDSNEQAGVSVAQPKSFDDRAGVARQFCSRLHPKMPVVVDEISDPAGHAYSGMPARLYVIDLDGKVAFKSGRGPFGFKPPELEQALAMCMTEISRKQSTTTPETPEETSSASALLSDEEAWAALPKASNAGGALPNWAKAVARQLPRTAAAMLKLDYAQRTKSPLEPRLRAKMRWVIASVNRCDYAQQTALADLKQSGASEEDIAALTGDPTGWPEEDRAALQFARELTLSAATIDDALFESLRKQYDDKQAAAMVLLGAYGNFQDRLLLGLEVPMEQHGPLAPLAIDFEPGAFQMAPILPPNRPAAPLLSDGKDVIENDADWASLSYQELQDRLARQRERKQRLPTPAWEDVAKTLPPEFNARPTRIVWNLVSMGYVPELALPWSMTTRTMWAEAQQDRVLEESLFWVQTRAIECNYCMGHCEMLLEVAGLGRPEIDARLRKLASDDWSAFPEAEQRAFAYARKLSKTPWDLKLADFQQLEQDFGDKSAMATFFWLCRGLYMTRVSDGFALTLEKDNVFADFARQTSEKK